MSENVINAEKGENLDCAPDVNYIQVPNKVARVSGEVTT